MRGKGFAFLLAAFMMAACSNPASHGKIEDVTEPEKEPAELTLMVYMAADNDLESYALENLKAMERAVYSKVNVLVLMDRSESYDETEGNWTDTRLFEVTHDEGNDSSIKSKRLSCPSLGLSETESTELDMANSSVLRNFIEFGKASYEAKNYALIIWGHGTGWRYCPENTGGNGAARAVAVDDRSGSYMSVHSLGQAVRGQGLKIIGFDTCFGGVLENVYELKDCADFTVACPGVTPSGGWNYKRLLETVSGSNFSIQNIAAAMAQSSSVAATVFTNAKLTELFTAFELFSRRLAASITNASSRDEVLNTLNSVRSYCYTQNPCDIYLDLFSLAEKYQASSNVELSQAAVNLKNTINQTVSSPSVSGSGVGVHYIPKTSSGAMAGVHSAAYLRDASGSDQCAFIKESQWWVPTTGGNSGSLLDKLFYTVY